MTVIERSKSAEMCKNQSGFALSEFLISAVVLLVASAAIFRMLTDVQQTAGYQTEVQSVLNNTRIAMQTVERYIRQAGNDPLNNGLAGITIVSAEEMKVQSDLTGSAGPGNPDKGDPDGDIDDSGESITIRYNSRTRSLELVPEGGPAQIVASYISAMSFGYYDAAGHATANGNEVRRVSLAISGASLLRDPRTGQVFAVELNSDIQVST